MNFSLEPAHALESFALRAKIDVLLLLLRERESAFAIKLKQGDAPRVS